jgi:hypothetical protein
MYINTDFASEEIDDELTEFKCNEKYKYTVYSLFADTPHKRTSPLNGHFLRDRQNMYGFANKIFPLKRTPY